jgi:hypothetical protein
MSCSIQHIHGMDRRDRRRLTVQVFVSHNMEITKSHGFHGSAHGSNIFVFFRPNQHNADI